MENLEEDVLIADSSDNVEIVEAKQAELQNWTTHNAYEEVDENNQKVISLRWVFSQKYKDSGIVCKACIVAKGFEEEPSNELRKDSPTCCKVSFQLVVGIIASNMWTIHSVDVKSAFLHGKEINRDVYVKPPQKAETDKLWKLKTTVYGLCDAPRV